MPPEPRDTRGHSTSRATAITPALIATMATLIPVAAALIAIRTQADVTPPTPAASPNVVVFLVDDQGWTATSVPMDPQLPESASDFYETPTLAALASEGMRFSHAYAPAAVCAASRASLETGRSPAALGRTRNRMPPEPLPPGSTPLAVAIHAADSDYVTGHFGKWHLAGGGPGAAGYDFHDAGSIGPDPHDPSSNPKDIFGIADRAEAFIRERHEEEEPFVVVISQHAPHLFAESRPATRAYYEAKPPGSRHHDPDFAAMITDLDAGLAQILALLDELEIEDETYVVYLSDNGGIHAPLITTNAPLAWGKVKLWEGGIRVPWIVRGPGIPAATVSDVPIIGWDLLPTILDWIAPGATPPPGVEGGSFRDVAAHPQGLGVVVRSDASLIWHYPHWRIPPQGNVQPHSAIQVAEPDGLYKLIRTYATPGEIADSLALFHLDTDPGEQFDLAAAQPTRAQAYHTVLETRLAALGAQLEPDPKPAGCGGAGWPATLAGTCPFVWVVVRRRSSTIGSDRPAP